MCPKLDIYLFIKTCLSFLNHSMHSERHFFLTYIISVILYKTNFLFLIQYMCSVFFSNLAILHTSRIQDFAYKTNSSGGRDKPPLVRHTSCASSMLFYEDFSMAMVIVFFLYTIAQLSLIQNNELLTPYISN